MVATLNAQQGHRLRVGASGAQAAEVLAAITKLAGENFGDTAGGVGAGAAGGGAPEPGTGGSAGTGGSGLDVAIGPAVLAGAAVDLSGYVAGDDELGRARPGGGDSWGRASRIAGRQPGPWGDLRRAPRAAERSQAVGGDPGGDHRGYAGARRVEADLRRTGGRLRGTRRRLPAGTGAGRASRPRPRTARSHRERRPTNRRRPELPRTALPTGASSSCLSWMRRRLPRLMPGGLPELLCGPRGRPGMG